MVKIERRCPMCTAVSFVTKDHYFGRNLDYEFSYGESVVITPRNYIFSFRNEIINKYESGLECKQMQETYKDKKFSMIGVAYVVDNYPLYYDAINEKGLGAAGLLFSGNAVYVSMEKEGIPVYCSRKITDFREEKKEGENGSIYITSYEFIPWILRRCQDIESAVSLLKRICITDQEFSKELPPSPLHWMLADKTRTIVIEAVEEGIKIYENPVHVLTNNPTFDYHLTNLSNYTSLSSYEPDDFFGDVVKLPVHSRGMGGMGLPGDLSSTSRFVRAAFTRMNSICGESEEESVSQFFHILGSVEQQRGCVRLKKQGEQFGGDSKEAEETDEKYEITIYSSCCNTDKGIYYYKTYDNFNIQAMDMKQADLTGSELVVCPMKK